MNSPAPSITDFLTDGSLAGLCQALARLTGARVSLHDERGRRIIHTDANPPWHVGNEGDPARRIAKALRRIGANPEIIPEDGRFLQPLQVRGVVVGALLVDVGGSSSASDTLEKLKDTVAYLARAVDELFEQDVALAKRNAELGALFRLSSLLVATSDLDEVLDVALKSALEILDIDAGLIYLTDSENSGNAPELHAQAGIDAQAAARLTSAIDPSSEQDTQALRKAAQREGFAGLVPSELTFRNTSVGRMVLLSKEPRVFERDEHTVLQTMSEQISAAIASARLIEDQRKSRQAARQLRLAGDVQKRMLPQSLPQVEGLSIAARCVPSLDLGGDFFDFLELGSNLGVLIGDVVGKGVPAALLMASVRATFRAHASSTYHLDQLMAQVNLAMVRDTLPNEFATVFYCVIDPDQRRLTYCSAGHDPTLLIRRSDPTDPTILDVHKLDQGGMIIGIDPKAKYERHIVDLQPGDTIVAYSDGAIDARNFQSERYGRDRFKDTILAVLQDNPDATAQQVLDHILWEVRRFVGLNPPTDDLTLVVLRYNA